jgi:hypothetical protein
MQEKENGLIIEVGNDSIVRHEAPLAVINGLSLLLSR